MDYQSLLTDSRIDYGWNTRLLRKKATLDDVTQALVLKNIRDGHRRLYASREIGAEAFVNSALTALGTSAKEIENLGYKISLGFPRQPEAQIADALVRDFAGSLSRNRDVRDSFEKAKARLCTNHRACTAMAALYTTMVTLTVVLPPYLHSGATFGDLLSADIGAASRGYVTCKLAQTAMRLMSCKFFRKMEDSAAATTHARWIGAAAEHDFAKISLRAAYDEPLELTPGTKHQILGMIDRATPAHAPDQMGGDGFIADISSKNPDLRSSQMMIAVAPDYERHPPQPDKRKKKQAAPRRDLVWSPSPMPGSA